MLLVTPVRRQKKKSLDFTLEFEIILGRRIFSFRKQACFYHAQGSGYGFAAFSIFSSLFKQGERAIKAFEEVTEEMYAVLSFTQTDRRSCKNLNFVNHTLYGELGR